MNARRRFSAIKPFLEALGLEKDRIKLDWIAASEGARVAETIEGFVAEIKKLGPNPINKKITVK